MRRLLTVLTAAGCITACMTAFSCSSSDGRSRASQEAELTRIAEENARSYVRGKYGFDAEILGMSRQYKGDGYDFLIPHFEETNNVYVKMEHDGREFVVYTSLIGNAEGGYDDYQAEEVEQALLDLINENIGDCVNLWTDFPWLYDYEYDGMMLSHDRFFDGSNLSEVLSGGLAHRLCAEFVGKDLSNEENFEFLYDILDDIRADYSDYWYFVSYRSEEALEEHSLVDPFEEEGGFFSDYDKIRASEEAAGIDNYRRFVPADGHEGTGTERDGYITEWYSFSSGEESSLMECGDLRWYSNDTAGMAVEQLSSEEAADSGITYMEEYPIYRVSGHIWGFTVMLPLASLDRKAEDYVLVTSLEYYPEVSFEEDGGYLICDFDEIAFPDEPFCFSFRPEWLR
ncbi:MAG: hypothetical protein IJ874_01970 [Ruminococcus sp.]|nr:hypothetical protein [Ruminococcus sp.]